MENNCELSFLSCYICFEDLKKPKMCPSCSKVACEKCLRTWIEEKRPECPHCRKMTPLSNFAECERFISDVRHLVQGMEKNTREKHKCMEHMIEMTYYCEECHEPICSDCGMFGSKHRTHKITHLKRVYQEYKNKILNELAKFDQKIEGFRKNGYQIKMEMQKLVGQIGQKKSYIEEYFVAILQRLEDEFKEKQEKITEKYQSNSKEIEFLDSFRENICRELQISSESQLITKSSELISYIQSVYDKGPDVDQQEHNFDTIHEIVPKYTEFKYTLKNYSTLGEAIIYSDPYLHNGIEWRLKIYPKGNGGGKDTHMSVFLEMTKAFTSGNKYEYKIELINNRSLKDSVVREYSSNFDIGQCWGYNQFIPIDELNNDFITDAGDLVFHVSVRNPSYRSLVRDQKQYIEFLEAKANSNLEKVEGVPSLKKLSNKVIGIKPGESQSLVLNEETKHKIKKILNPHSEGEDNLEEEIEEGFPKMNRIASSRHARQEEKKSESRLSEIRPQDGSDEEAERMIRSIVHNLSP